MRMLVPHPAVRFYIFRRWLRCSKAPLTLRDKAFLYQPTSIRYAFEVGVLSSTFIIGLSFAILSPIVSLGCGLCFMIGWVLWRYSMLYIFIRKYESGGMLW